MWGKLKKADESVDKWLMVFNFDTNKVMSFGIKNVQTMHIKTQDSGSNLITILRKNECRGKCWDGKNLWQGCECLFPRKWKVGPDSGKPPYSSLTLSIVLKSQ